MRLEWSKLDLSTENKGPYHALKRSSNSISIVGDKAFVFGGESEPRQPVDDELWVVDLTSGKYEAAASSTKKPSARVGSALTAIDSDLYLWGGRESKDMTPCNSDLWKYDTAAAKWEIVKAGGTKGDSPVLEDRSFHVISASEKKLYLHAGCPSAGRSSDLHSFSTESPTSHWETLPAGPGPGRGGTVLCPVELKSSVSDIACPLFLRYGGFAGYEIGSSLDIYHVDKKHWSSLALPNREGEAGHPLARSVHALVPVSPPITHKESDSIVALMLFGERGPAPAHLGHNGAGQFHDDVWAIVQDGKEITEENPWGLRFELVEQTGSNGSPTARGWFACASKQGGQVIVQGGLNDENERLDDCWIGQLKD